MKKSTIILIVFTAVIFIIQFNVIFEVKQEVDKLQEEIGLVKLDEQKLPSNFKTLILKDRVVASAEQSEQNLVLTNDSVYTYEINTDTLLVSENENVKKQDNPMHKGVFTLKVNPFNSIIVENNANLSSDEPMTFDTLYIEAKHSSQIWLSNIEVNVLNIKAYDNSSINFRRIKCGTLNIVSDNHSKVIVKGEVVAFWGDLKGESYVRVPPVSKSSFSKEELVKVNFY